MENNGFEEAEGRIMQPHQARVVEEKDELSIKYQKLSGFINTMPFHKLSDNERNLLKMQVLIMKQYIEILEMRIETF